jgi:hypothetical protein
VSEPPNLKGDDERGSREEATAATFGGGAHNSLNPAIGTILVGDAGRFAIPEIHSASPFVEDATSTGVQMPPIANISSFLAKGCDAE